MKEGWNFSETIRKQDNVRVAGLRPLQIIIYYTRTMRHKVRKHLKFNRKTFSHRKSMQRNLLTSFFLHKGITTTEKKAKSIVPMIDKLINTANTKDEMNAIRYVMEYLFTEEASKELFKNVAPKYKGAKTSGFTKIVPVKYRDGDNAKLVALRLV